MSRRIWFARDTGFTADPRIQVLGDEHGPGAPLVIEELMALAKLADDGGKVTVPYATVARRAFVSPALVKKVIDEASSSGLVELCQNGGKTVTVAFPRWERWQPKDVTGAVRKRRLRERERNGDVT